MLLRTVENDRGALVDTAIAAQGERIVDVSTGLDVYELLSRTDVWGMEGASVSRTVGHKIDDVVRHGLLHLPEGVIVGGEIPGKRVHLHTTTERKQLLDILTVHGAEVRIRMKPLGVAKAQTRTYLLNIGNRQVIIRTVDPGKIGRLKLSGALLDPEEWDAIDHAHRLDGPQAGVIDWSDPRSAVTFTSSPEDDELPASIWHLKGTGGSPRTQAA
jgi:hypothetical protein